MRAVYFFVDRVLGRICNAGGNGRGDTIRTCDVQLPKLALYQTELRPGGKSV